MKKRKHYPDGLSKITIKIEYGEDYYSEITKLIPTEVSEDIAKRLIEWKEKYHNSYAKCLEFEKLLKGYLK